MPRHNGKSASLGRIPASELEARRQTVLNAAFEELIEVGYERLTMLGVANRASCSKATLYDWFGDREGLFVTLIEENANVVAARVNTSLETNSDPIEVLTAFATGLLTLLCSKQSIALNRAAMSSPELARILLASGRFRVGPLIERYLTKLVDQGIINTVNVETAFSVFYGLIVQDTQIRVLLGDRPPTKSRIRAQASKAVQQLVQLITKNQIY